MEKKKQTSKGRRNTPRRAKARTEDVLGSADSAVKIRSKWKRLYDRLLHLQARLTGRRQVLVKDAREESPSFSLHMADAGTDEYDRDLALSMVSSEQDALYEIEQAINRIKNGTYGVCELTGKPIEIERLEAIPWTRFSAEAERRLEKNGDVTRARLGDRERVPQVARSEPGESEVEDIE